MAAPTVHPRDLDLEIRSVDLHGDLRALLERAWGAGTGWVLGHAFDGVLWGLVEGGRLVTAADEGVAGAAHLRAETLLDLRIFDGARELRVWRGPDGLLACDVREQGARPGSPAGYHAFQDRAYVLMGAGQETPVSTRFVELRGTGGQRHTPPRLDETPWWLCVRHYFRREENGLLRAAEHRLLGLQGRESQ